MPEDIDHQNKQTKQHQTQAHKAKKETDKNNGFFLGKARDNCKVQMLYMKPKLPTLLFDS